MADERAGAPQPKPDAATESKITTGGRKANAAQPLNAARDRGGPERYPPAGRTDSVEGEARSFDSRKDAPRPRQGAGDGGPVSGDEGLLGPRGDPAEGKP